MPRAVPAAASLALLLACASGLLAACGLTRPGSDLMDKTTPGAQRCVLSGDEAKLFVIDWDGTDVASFQSRAARDVVFVQYADCQLRILDGCSDASLAGRYGTYREPVSTSSSYEAFSIRTKDDLAAKLPLGMVSLGGEVAANRMLTLQYFVAGVVNAARDEVYAAELADNPRCAGATHVVYSYTLGAFELSRGDATQLGGGVDYQGIGVSGQHAESTDVLRKGGDLSACRKTDRHACQVPIRLTLRPIRRGGQPAAMPATVAPAPGGDPNLVAARSMMNAVQYRLAAEQKYLAGDGPGCVRDLDLADHDHPQGRLRRLELRAKCEMRAGQCEQGKAHLREVRQAWYRSHHPTGLATDATIAAEVEEMAQRECPSQAGDGKSAQLSAMEHVKGVMQANNARDAQACVAHGEALSKIAAEGDSQAQQIASAGLKIAAECAGAQGHCAEARRFYLVFATQFMKQDPASAEAGFAQSVPQCRDK